MEFNSSRGDLMELSSLFLDDSRVAEAASVAQKLRKLSFIAAVLSTHSFIAVNLFIGHITHPSVAHYYCQRINICLVINIWIRHSFCFNSFWHRILHWHLSITLFQFHLNTSSG